MEEELEAPQGRLGTSSGKGYEVGRAKESMPIDGAEDVEVARREDDVAHRGALEARPAGLGLMHRESAYRPVVGSERRHVRPPSI
jgi:hypothetical protein